MATAIQTALSNIASLRAPSGGGALQAFNQAAGQVSGGFEGLQKTLQDYATTQQDEQTEAALGALNQEIRRVQAEGGDVGAIDAQAIIGQYAGADAGKFRTGSESIFDRAYDREQQLYQREQDALANTRADEQLELQQLDSEIKQAAAAERKVTFQQQQNDRTDLKAGNAWATSYEVTVPTEPTSEQTDTAVIRKQPIAVAREQLQADIDAAVQAGELSAEQATIAYDAAMKKIDTNYKGAEGKWSSLTKGEDGNLYAIEQSTGQTKRVIVGSDGGVVAAGGNPKFTKEQQELSTAANDSYITATNIVDTIGEITPSDVNNVTGITSLGGQWTPETRSSGGKFNQLIGQQFLDGVEAMRGLGALSDKEGAKIAQAASGLIDPETGQLRTGLTAEFVNAQLQKIQEGAVRMQTIAQFTQDRGREPNINEYNQILEAQRNPQGQTNTNTGTTQQGTTPQANNDYITTSTGVSYRIVQ